MPPEIWIIIGKGSVGKSTAIRALTGAARVCITNVQTHQGTLRDVFVQIRSLQEKKITPSAFIRAHKNDRFILLSLRIDALGIYPNGITYIQDFIKNNWIIREIVVLGTNTLPYTLPRGLPTPLYIPNSRHIPANQVASQIRGVWNWL